MSAQDDADLLRRPSAELRRGVASAVTRGRCVAGRDGVLRDPVVWAWVATAVIVQALYIALADPLLLAGDQSSYVEISQGFATWWSRPGTEMLRMPGYPFVLAVLHEIGLGGAVATQALQAAMLAGCVLIVAALGDRLGGRSTARVAGGLLATYLPLLSFSAMRLTEAMTVFCVLAAAACAVKAADRCVPGWLWWCCGSGLLMAAGFVTRPGSVVVSLPLIVLIVLGRRGTRERAAAILVLGVAFALLLGPWVGRNQALNGALLPTGTTGEYPAALGVHLPFDRAVGKFATYERSVRFWAGTREDGFGTKQAAAQDWGPTLRRNVVDRPGEMFVTRLVGQYQLWGWPVTANVQYGQHDVPYAPLMAWHLALISAGLVGFWRYRRAAVVCVGIATVGLTAALHLVTFPQPRYALLAMPFLMLATAALLTRAPTSTGAARDSPV